MKYIASCSGGKDSVATLLLAKQCGEPLDEVIFSEVMFDENISGELPEHMEFIHKMLKPWIENILGVPFKILRTDKTYLDCFYQILGERSSYSGKIYGYPISSKCAINRDCKIPPIKQYLKNIPELTQYIGVAADEPKRLKRLENTNKVSLLDKYDYTEKMAYKLCADNGLLSPIYQFAKRGGCWFCPNMRNSELRHLYEYHPDLWQKLLDLQDVQGKVTENFNRTETFSQIDFRFRAQMILC